MNDRARAILLLVIQCLLVSSIAGKYLYERATRPRVWVKVAPNDPFLPMRGRYLALSPMVDACSLPHDKESGSPWTPMGKDGKPGKQIMNWRWQVIAKDKDGKLVVEDARHVLPRSETQTIWLESDKPCESARLTPGIDFFIPDTAKSPWPLKPGQTLWAEVTIPPKGPPRPIQLALSDNGQWKPLKFE